MSPDYAAADSAPERVDIAVVGGGILGLAVARELLRRHPSSSLCVLEREADVAAHQTGHNSGVIHAGVYYAPGSLKAQLCVRGRRLLYPFLEAHGVGYERCGKIVVATSEAEIARVEAVAKQAALNDVEELEMEF